MKRWCVLLAWMSLQMATASSDPGNLEGGVFLAHHPPGIQYSQGVDWCARYWQEFAIDSCEEQHNRIDLDGNEGQSSIWYVLAAWSEEKEWCGAEFGFGEYDPDVYSFVEWGPCSPGDNLEIPTANWPGPSQGTAVTTTDAAWSGNFVPIYFFAGYAYYEGVIPLAVDPATDFGGTGNCAAPPESWAAAGFGGMGIFTNGISVCPEGGLDDGGAGPEGGSDTAEDEDDGGVEDGRTTLHVCPDGSGDYTTIQEAIDAATHGDIIELCDATFRGDLNRNIDLNGKGLTIRSGSGHAPDCTIDCQGSEPADPEIPRRAFVFDSDDGADVLIAGIRILDGRAGDPG